MPGNKWGGQGVDLPVTDAPGGGGGGDPGNGKLGHCNDHEGAGQETKPGSTGSTGTQSGSKAFATPVKGGAVTASFAENRPGYKHRGVDIGVPAGTGVRAAEAGKVITTKFDDKAGWMIVIAHGGGLVTGYCHLKEPPTLKEGTKVTRGQVIGAAGSTGKSTGPHLHFYVHDGKEYVDPARYVQLPPPKANGKPHADVEPAEPLPEK